jgi:tripartite-type tricarboxylate transporter receptor subunit TctC
MTLVAKSSLPPNSFSDLVTYLKTNGKKVNMAHAGLGSVSHLCGLLFQQALQTELTTVAYKGTGPAMTDLMGGQVDLMCDQTTNTTAYIQSGKIKVYGVTTLTRVPSLKNVATLDELGLKKFDLSAWHGLWAAKGTPQPVIERLSKALQVALRDPDVVKRFADLGTVPVKENEATPAALQARVNAEVERWVPIIKAAGQYID